MDINKKKEKQILKNRKDMYGSGNLNSEKREGRKGGGLGILSAIERERETEGDREGERWREMEREGERWKEKERECERERDGERGRERERDGEIEGEREREGDIYI